MNSQKDLRKTDVMKTSIIKVKEEECDMGISSVISLAQTQKVECTTKGSSSSSASVLFLAPWVRVMWVETLDKLVDL